VSTYAPPVHAHYRPHVDLRLGAIIGLAAALIGLGSWVLVDRHTGGGGATQKATTLLDNFYTAVSSPKRADATTITRLLTSDAVFWTNGDESVGARAIGNDNAQTPGLNVKRIAPVTVWGNFAATYIQFSVPAFGLNGPMVEIVQIKDGRIFRLWDFALGVTPPLTNAVVP
jgi:hypothetical protein